MIRAEGLVKKFGDFTAVDHIQFLRSPEAKSSPFLDPTARAKALRLKCSPRCSHWQAAHCCSTARTPSLSQAAVRKSFGIVFQDPSGDSELTAYENMELHGALYGVPGKLRHGAHRGACSKSSSLWDRRKDAGQQFSGGMQRRLENRPQFGFCIRPRIIFLDEPTLGLDPQTRNLLWAHVKKRNHEEKDDRLPHHPLLGRS